MSELKQRSNKEASVKDQTVPAPNISPLEDKGFAFAQATAAAVSLVRALPHSVDEASPESG